MKKILAYSATAAAVLVAACGGGSGGDSDAGAGSGGGSGSGGTAGSGSSGGASGASPQPVAGYRTDRTVTLASRSAIFENELYFVDQNGQFTEPQPTDFAMAEVAWNADNGAKPIQSFSVEKVICGTAGQSFSAGNYSALMLFDRSSSMTTNDPGGLSVEAGRIFADAMAGADQAAVSAFPKSPGNNRPFELNTYTSGFTSDKAEVKRAINSVGAPEGGTPLYDSILSSVAYTAQNGKNTNKALIAFTDGDDTSSQANPVDVVTQSQRAGVPIFSVGLKNASLGVMSAIAKNTGGGFFYANDAQQLAAAYKSLGPILGGRARSCTVTIKTDLTGAPEVKFSATTGRTWTFTRTVNINGIKVPFMFRQGFDAEKS